MKTKVSGRAPVAPVSSGPPGSVSDFAEVAQDEIAGLVDEVSIESKLKEWAARENPESLVVRTYVYKYDNPSTGDNKVLCDRIDADIPDPHQVGIMYGAGRYMMIVAIPAGAQQAKNVRGLRFRLHARYDELRKNAAGGGVPAPMFAPAAPAQSSLAEGIAVVRSVLEMLKPILETKAIAAPAAPDVSKLLEGQYDMMAGVLRKSLDHSQELIAEVNKAKLENGPVTADGDEPDFLSKVMPLIEKFLPLILGGGGAAATTAAAIRAIPEVNKVIADRAELGRVVLWLDKTQGKEKTDRILAALKVRRPGNNGRVVQGRSVLRPAVDTVPWMKG